MVSLWEYLDSEYMKPLIESMDNLTANGADPKAVNDMRMILCRMHGYVWKMIEHEKEEMKP